MEGYAATKHGWVQSYGSRYVRPPILFGDVSHPEPMTVRWASYAHSRTRKPVKGMLTGPVTMLDWSFVRDDQPPGKTTRQVALALRDETRDLEAAGIRTIQVDEPALCELLPLRRADRAAYIETALRTRPEDPRLPGDGGQPQEHGPGRPACPRGSGLKPVQRFDHVAGVRSFSHMIEPRRQGPASWLAGALRRGVTRRAGAEDR